MFTIISMDQPESGLKGYSRLARRVSRDDVDLSHEIRFTSDGLVAESCGL
jgi:hypothetical protein